jgi:hypothetical protein
MVRTPEKGPTFSQMYRPEEGELRKNRPGGSGGRPAHFDVEIANKAGGADTAVGPELAAIDLRRSLRAVERFADAEYWVLDTR